MSCTVICVYLGANFDAISIPRAVLELGMCVWVVPPKLQTDGARDHMLGLRDVDTFLFIYFVLWTWWPIQRSSEHLVDRS